MYIQIDQVGFRNKGAELMLWSIIDRLKNESQLQPKFVFGRGPATPEQIRRAGMYQKFSFQRFKLRIEDVMPQKRLDPFGIVKHEEINVLLDAGGFQFGDQWGDIYSEKSISELNSYYNKFKSIGAKIIFLPQAFGPFDLPLSKALIKIVFESADLIYARDTTSYNNLIEIFGEQPKIRLAPDFTSLLTSDVSLSLFQRVKDSICFIPNSKMVTHSNSGKTNYITFLSDMANEFIKNGEKVIFLNHEGKDDLNLIKSITKALNTEVDIVDGLDALQIKAVISHVKILISSRFHGVASGLNQCIPTFCTSWSHKYVELLKQYNCLHAILDLDNDLADTMQHIDKYKNVVCTKSTIDNLKSSTNEMWREVIDTLSYR
ncbi:polysaccharide pyruvyl transferase family protein [Pontibacter sp. 13R65]|uniref:polysaccharide pyruvyl transferase family protein n=1 Tax=Pontibacter sp. 13R65 TaxID=3127458 RepID=UPI00301C0F06